MPITVNRSDWESLSAEDRQKIQRIIGEHFEGETVSPGEGGEAKLSGNPACEAACNVAEAAAVSACSGVPFPGNIVCVAAAREAGKFCRSRC